MTDESRPGLREAALLPLPPGRGSAPLCGTVEHVASGTTEPFRDPDDLVCVIVSMLDPREPGMRTPSAAGRGATPRPARG